MPHCNLIHEARTYKLLERLSKAELLAFLSDYEEHVWTRMSVTEFFTQHWVPAPSLHLVNTAKDAA